MSLSYLETGSAKVRGGSKATPGAMRSLAVSYQAKLVAIGAASLSCHPVAVLLRVATTFGAAYALVHVVKSFTG